MGLTSKERLRRCYFNEETDRPAVFCRMGSTPPDDKSYDPLRALLAAKSDMKYAWDGRQFELPYSSSVTIEQYSEDYERRRTVVYTPKGDLVTTLLVGLNGQPGRQEEYLLKDGADAEKFLSLPQPQIEGDVSTYLQMEKRAGDRGIVDVSLGMNPAGSVVELFGTETFALMSITERRILHRLMGRQTSIILDTLRFLLSRGVGPFFSMAGEEYVAPPIHGAKDFDDFNARYDKPIIDAIHDADGRIHIHCHGSIKRVIPRFVELGVDVLHPFEAPHYGDVLPSEAKALARGKMCLEGNIQIADMYEQPPEAIREQVLELMDTVFDDHRGLIVCPSASPYIPGKGGQCFENYKVLVDTVLEYPD